MMKRRQFNHLTALATSSLFLPGATWQSEPSIAEITGRVKPALYGEGFQLRKEAAEAFQEMSEAAGKAGFQIRVVSSYRSFDDQKRIWNNKYDRFTKAGDSPKAALDRIIEYSTIPGTSRHHWATDIDIVDGTPEVEGDVLLSHLFEGNGPYAPLKKWLDANAPGYGFKEVYTRQANRRGFKYEPWHLSYTPLSIGYLKQYMNVGFDQLIRSLEIKGKEHLDEDFIKKYWEENMLDINPELIPD